MTIHSITRRCRSFLPIALLATLSGCMVVAPVPEPVPAVVVASPAPTPAKVVVAEPRPVVKATPAPKVAAKPATPVAKPAAAVRAPHPYPVIVFTGHARWEPKADALQEQVDQGPDFNEHYKVARLSCGTDCWDNVIIDTDTGYIIDEVQSCGSTEYSLHSDVINIPVRPSKHAQCRMVSYKVEGNVLIRL